MIGRKTLQAAPLLAAGAAVLMLAGTLAAQQPTKAAAQEATCTAAIAPQSLKVQKDAFQLRAALSQSIGDVSAVSVQEQGSGVQVALAAGAHQADAAQAGTSGMKPASDAAAHQDQAGKSDAAPASAQPAAPAAADHGPQVVWLSLNSSVAKPGDYTVQLQGSKGACSGKVTITATDQGTK